MKKKTLAFILTLCMTVTGVVCFAAGAAAAGGLQEIKAYLNADITLKLDGEAQVLKDASGVCTYPITYNGTTYLPIRSIGTLLGVDVGWDQATQSVLLGKQPSGVDLIETYDIYHTTLGNSNCSVGQVKDVDKKTEDISGVTRSHWIYLNSSDGAEVAASYNLLGKHDTLTFTYYSDKDVTLKVLGDNGSILGEFSITGGAVAKTVTVPLFSTSELKFEVAASESRWVSPRVRIIDAYLDAEQ